MHGPTSLLGNLQVSANNNLFVEESTSQVAIGHANPSAKLDVIGTTELNGNLTVQNASVFVKGGNLAVFNNTQSATPPSLRALD